MALMSAKNRSAAETAEQRLQFLLELGDALRDLNDPHAVKAMAVERLGRYVEVARAGFGDIDPAEEQVSVDRDWTDGSVASLAGESRLLDGFGPLLIRELKAGRTLVVEDSATDPRATGEASAAAFAGIDVRSLVVAPLVKGGHFTNILYLHEPQPRHWTEAEIALTRDVAERTWDAVERARAEAALRDREAQLRYVLSAAHAGTWDWSPSKGTLSWSDENYDMHGIDPSIPPSPAIWEATVHSDDRERAWHTISDLLAKGGRDFALEYRVIHPQRGVRWLLGLGKIERSGDGTPIRIAGINLDITGRKLAEERHKLVAREVDHRAKNVLALVQVIIRQTRADTVADFTSRIMGRIRALARVHTLLSQSRWVAANLKRIIDDELAPFRTVGRSRVQVEGPDVGFTPESAQCVAMALHELATNAAKHGALAGPQGAVRIEWVYGDDGPLVVRWTESGGPPVQPVPRHGLGLEVIERTIGGQLGGAARFDWRPEGLICELIVPWEKLTR
jgi:two-component sensor histidine kinase